MIPVNDFDALKIGIASPEKIKEWSYGEVTKPETINYRTLKPEPDGLFCERIFGPKKDYECACGKYKRVRYKNIICDRCGVEVTSSKTRRERMGHIALATPVSHIWFFKGVPSRMSLVLDISPRDLEEVLYFVSYIVLDKGNTTLMEKQVLSENDYQTYYAKYGNSFRVGMGAEAIKELLKKIDLKKEMDEIEEELPNASEQRKVRLVKRLDALNAFYKSNQRPEWMIIDNLPVIPPELRPMIQLDGGRFATSDLNDLYRRVINRNNRLKKLLELSAPNIIVQNEKRMLQEAVDSLFDNGRRGRSVTGAGNRPLKSLASILKGKQGRFRQNLLGKRVDYSGRSVIVVGPELKMYQCGLPKDMAIELFKPHLIRGLVEKGLATNIKAAKKLIETKDNCVWNVVEEIIREYPVLLNRAPTLHRLGIQAFEPILIDGKAIRLHPLVCAAFNADFDGDQMPVHVPLSEEAKAEARILMLGSNNILNLKDGKPIVTPSQDMVLGNYYITMEKAGLEGEGRVFKNPVDAMMAYERREITLQTRIAIKADAFKHKILMDNLRDKYLITTPGKIKFNDILPDSFSYINEPTEENIQGMTPSKYFVDKGENIKEKIASMPLVEPFKKGTLEQIIAEVFRRYQTTETSIMLDKMKDLGFKESTKSGITISLADILECNNKSEIIEKGEKEVQSIEKQYKRGLITDEERYNKVVDVWFRINDEVQKELNQIAKANPDNPIFIMMFSKARGSLDSFRQIAGMRGMTSKPNGKFVEIPITSSFKDGMSIAEFFLSTHGSRKTQSDKSLKTAESGYLTRRLVDVSQNIIVREDDCGTENGLVVKEFVNESTKEVIESLFDRIAGRYTNKKIIHPETKEEIIGKGEYITDNIAEKIIAAGIKEVEIRSVLTCGSHNGVCKKCYGRNLANGQPVEVGEPVGVIAAQSIGEPGTQLTMRTFHGGGVGGEADITQGLPRVEELFETRTPASKATIAEISGTVTEVIDGKGKTKGKVIISNKLETKEHTTNYNPKFIVKVGDTVEAGDKLTEGSISPKELMKATDALTVQQYILKEVQSTYRSQGVGIADKHIEIIARRMASRIKIYDSGDTSLLSGLTVSFKEFQDINKEAIMKGKRPARGEFMIQGITKASLDTDSFLAAASFQETTRILTEAAVNGKIDELDGLKENVLIGKLIPAGTGSKKYKHVTYTSALPFDNSDPLDDFEEGFME